jgi:hypothetical protein
MSNFPNDFGAPSGRPSDDPRFSGSGDEPGTSGLGQPPRTIIIGASTPKPKAPVFAWIIRMEGPEAGKAIQLAEGETLLGRDPTRATILLDDPTVSSLHAKIMRTEEDEGKATYTLYDLGSSNGTWIGEDEVFEQPLEDGTHLRVGRTKLLFKCL